MIYFEHGASDYAFTPEELKRAVFSAFDRLGNKKRVLVIPPDFTRFHSRAGELTQYAYEYYGSRLTDILPALGTHLPMTKSEIGKMFPGVPRSLFRVHKWRKDVVTLGVVPGEYVKECSEGLLDYDWPAQVNRLLVEGDYDLILSLGQVVPHEVIGMANYNKNIFVGTGGAEGINKSHFVGAVYGMERIMGRANNPVRALLNYASEHFTAHLPIVYLQTVVSQGEDGLQMRGLFIGDDFECFEKAAALSLRVNFQMLDREMKKVVVYLNPEEYKSTWLGNKSIYRTRMAIADGGELIVIAPGVQQFGEDKENDHLIRKFGYMSKSRVLEVVSRHKDLQNNLGVAAHLIHGTSEGRFRIIYSPGHLSRQDVENVGFRYVTPEETMRSYPPHTLKDGWNIVRGEEIYFISNPALGLWAYKERFI